MTHGRLIDADALIEDIRKNSASYFADDFAHEWVDRQPTIEERKWTPCNWHKDTENLPDECESVLICIKDKLVLLWMFHIVLIITDGSDTDAI